MRKAFFLVLAVGVIIAFAQPGFGQVQKLASSEFQVPAKIKVEESTATVVSVDYENRTGMLKLPDGTMLAFKARPELKDFDLVKVGDKVLIR